MLSEFAPLQATPRKRKRMEKQSPNQDRAKKLKESKQGVKQQSTLSPGGAALQRKAKFLETTRVEQVRPRGSAPHVYDTISNLIPLDPHREKAVIPLDPIDKSGRERKEPRKPKLILTRISSTV